jgi:hypothetical protein
MAEVISLGARSWNLGASRGVLTERIAWSVFLQLEQESTTPVGRNASAAQCIDPCCPSAWLIQRLLLAPKLTTDLLITDYFFHYSRRKKAALKAGSRSLAPTCSD